MPVTWQQNGEGMTFDEAYEKMCERNYFGMMMVETGEADALITGVYSRYADSLEAAKEVVGIRDGLNQLLMTLYFVTLQSTKLKRYR